MKTLSIRALGLLLVLFTQVFAQRFTAGIQDTFISGTMGSGVPLKGYMPQDAQAAALGEKNSSFANLMLLAAQGTDYNVVSSHGNVLGTVSPINSSVVFANANGDYIYDNTIGAVVVLDSLNDNKKTATVLFSIFKRLSIMQISVTETNTISSVIIKSFDMPDFMWELDDNYHSPGMYRRLALLGISQDGVDKVYHLAIGNPLSKKQSGRVDFFSLSENSWTYSQPNITGLTSGFSGLLFGSDLVSIGDLDKNGHNELVVLLPASQQHPNSAIYIFFMDNEWTPSSKQPVIITEKSEPWLKYPDRIQDCRGLGRVGWRNSAANLLVACNTKPILGVPGTQGFFIKELILDSSGNILNSYIFFEDRVGETSSYSLNYNTYSNPLSLKNHKNDLYAVSLATNGPVSHGAVSSIKIFSVMDADYSKNYLLGAGKPEIIIDLDSLFYKSGTSGFLAKTLFGLVQCGIQNNHLLCDGEENAIGSWSALELSSRSECDPHKECKRKDTIYVYVRSQSESSNTALRIPKNIVIPFFGQVNLGRAKSLSYFKNPDLHNTGINWNENGLKLSTVISGSSNELSIIPVSQKEGMDTLVFNLSISAATDNYPVYLHITDTSKILENAIPGNPGEDTVWNTAQKKYIALPGSNFSGGIYTYDIAQDGLGAYAEITGGYLHILKVDVAEIYVAYTENAQVKQRKITLMPEAKPQEPSFAATSPFNRSLNAVYTNGGLQISGINGEFELRAYSFKGEEVQRTRANAKGSVFVKLMRNHPQVVQIRSGSQKIIFYIAPYAISR